MSSLCIVSIYIWYTICYNEIVKKANRQWRTNRNEVHNKYHKKKEYRLSCQGDSKPFGKMETILEDIEIIKGEEEEYRDNIPENLHWFLVCAARYH